MQAPLSTPTPRRRLGWEVTMALTTGAIWILAPAITPAAVPPGARLAATCTGCHGTNGVTVGDAIPALAGQSKDALLASLKAFKAGERPATVMTQLAKGYNDQQLDELAVFFARQDASGASR